MDRQHPLAVAINRQRTVIMDKVATVLTGLYAGYSVDRNPQNTVSKVAEGFDFWVVCLLGGARLNDMPLLRQMVLASQQMGLTVEQLISNIEQILCIMVGVVAPELPTAEREWAVKRLYTVLDEMRTNLLLAGQAGEQAAL